MLRCDICGSRRLRPVRPRSSRASFGCRSARASIEHVVVLLIAICCAPWLAAIAWIVHRHGLSLLIPRDDVPISFGDMQRRR